MDQYLCIGEGPKWGPKRRGLEGSINMGSRNGVWIQTPFLDPIFMDPSRPLLLGPHFGPSPMHRY